MVGVLPESRGNILMVKATDKLTDQDYQSTLIPRLEAIIQEKGKARFLFYLDENFQGVEPGAMWADAKFGFRHLGDFEKIAVVGAPRWMEWGTKFFAHLMKGEVKTYPLEQLPEAKDWIES